MTNHTTEARHTPASTDNERKMPKVDPATYDPLQCKEHINPNLIVWEYRNGICRSASEAVIRYIYWHLIGAEKNHRGFYMSETTIARKLGITVDAVHAATKRTSLFHRDGRPGQRRRRWVLDAVSANRAPGRHESARFALSPAMADRQIDGLNPSDCRIKADKSTVLARQVDGSHNIEVFERSNLLKLLVEPEDATTKNGTQGFKDRTETSRDSQGSSQEYSPGDYFDDSPDASLDEPLDETLEAIPVGPSMRPSRCSPPVTAAVPLTPEAAMASNQRHYAAGLVTAYRLLAGAAVKRLSPTQRLWNIDAKDVDLMLPIIEKYACCEVSPVERVEEMAPAWIEEQVRIASESEEPVRELLKTSAFAAWLDARLWEIEGSMLSIDFETRQWFKMMEA